MTFMKENIPVWLSIFIAALIAGGIFGIGLKTGVTPDEGSISIFVMENFCNAVQDDNEIVKYNCGLFLFWMIVISIIMAIVAVIEEAKRMDNFIIGLFIYGMG